MVMILPFTDDGDDITINDYDIDWDRVFII